MRMAALLTRNGTSRPGVVGTVERVLELHDGVGAHALSLEAVLAADTWARRAAREVLDRR